MSGGTAVNNTQAGVHPETKTAVGHGGSLSGGKGLAGRRERAGEWISLIGVGDEGEEGAGREEITRVTVRQESEARKEGG